MLISEIFKPENIIIKLKSKDKKKLFEELVNFLVDIEYFNNKDEILKNLWERENKMTTSIAPNIAIPHTNIDNLNKTTGLLGISKEGIEYDSLDGKPVHVIIFLLGNKNDPTEHLNVLKNIATMLNNPNFYNQLIKCTTPANITETIIKFENLVNNKKENNTGEIK